MSFTLEAVRRIRTAVRQVERNRARVQQLRMKRAVRLGGVGRIGISITGDDAAVDGGPGAGQMTVDGAGVEMLTQRDVEGTLPLGGPGLALRTMNCRLFFSGGAGRRLSFGRSMISMPYWEVPDVPYLDGVAPALTVSGSAGSTYGATEFAIVEALVADVAAMWAWLEDVATSFEDRPETFDLNTATAFRISTSSVEFGDLEDGEDFVYTSTLATPYFQSDVYVGFPDFDFEPAIYGSRVQRWDDQVRKANASFRKKGSAAAPSPVPGNGDYVGGEVGGSTHFSDDYIYTRVFESYWSIQPF